MAALIGIVGMFIVYRLQIQQDNINNALRILREYLGMWDSKDYSHLTQEEIVSLAETKIKFLTDSIKKMKSVSRISRRISKKPKMRSIEELILF